MILYLSIAITAVAICTLVKPATNPQRTQPMSRQSMLNMAALLLAFLTLFIFQSLRLNVGNDYIRYVELMHLVTRNAYVPTEPGFNLVVQIIYGLSGFNNYLMVFAIFSFMTLAFFMRAMYRDSDNFLLSFFLYMAFGYYFQSFSSVRYYLALAIALFAIPYLLKKQWLPFVAWVLLGAAFHKSALVVLPLYFLATLNWKKWMLVLAGLFCISLFFMQDFYLRIMLFLYPTYENTDYLEGGSSLINIIRCAAVLVFSLIYYRQAIKDNPRNRFYFYLNLGALILYTCASFIPVVSRIGYYLTVTHILFLPAIISCIENRRQRRFFTGLIICAGILYLLMYLILARADGIRLYPYQTFLFHELPLILSTEL